MAAPPANKTIVIIVEGDTERAAKDHLKRFIDKCAGGKPKVRLHPVVLDGALTEASVRGIAETALSNESTIGVVALTDVYPAFKSASHARTTVASWMPDDPRCHAHAACHDFEAWLLVGWDALLEQSGAPPTKPWATHPETVNTNSPPAHRVRDLFQRGKPKPRKYKKPIDGKKLFEKLRLEDVAEACPEFKAFVNTLLSIAEYPILT